MSNKLHIGPKLTLPADTVTGTLIVYGGKGQGKTVLAAVVCEEMAAAGQRFSVIDPMGVFWGLRHSADGKGSGIEVLILGGKHGDIPIEPTGGAVVADLVADESVNVIIDISRKPDGKMWGRGERIRFVADYCTRLYERQGEGRRPLLQIIDECGRFCPEQIRKDQPEIARCLGAVAELTEEARNVGVGVMLITQRSARMSKSVSELADAMFAFRTVGPRSVDAITDWLGDHVPRERHKEITEAIRKLPRGSALVISPGWLEYEGVAEIRMRHTFDSSATPKAGKETRASGKGAMPDLTRYQLRMAETIERVKESDPTELKKQLAAARKTIADLERKTASTAISQKSNIAVGTEDNRRVSYQRGYDAGVKETKRAASLELNRYEKATTAHLKRVAVAVERSATAAKEAQAAIEGFVRPEMTTLEIPAWTDAAPIADTPRAPNWEGGSMAERLKPSRPVVRRTVQNEAPNGSRRLLPAEQRILDAIAEFEALQIPRPARVQVAFMAGYTNLNSKGFTNALGALRTAGQIEYPSNGTIGLTAEGRRAAATVDAPLTSKELQARLIDMLGGTNGRILRILIDAYPKSVERDKLGEQSGYTNLNSKGFTNAIGRLRTLGLIDYPERGTVQATRVLFIDGEAYETA